MKPDGIDYERGLEARRCERSGMQIVLLASHRMRHRSTLSEVASRAGVSPTTVSHALSGKRPVAASTRKSIERAARELHYRPNAVARSLRTRRSHTAGLIIPDISNPFYPRLARGLQDELAGGRVSRARVQHRSPCPATSSSTWSTSSTGRSTASSSSRSTFRPPTWPRCRSRTSRSSPSALASTIPRSIWFVPTMAQARATRRVTCSSSATASG